MSNLITEKGDDGNIWMTHLLTGCAIAVCRKENDKWYVAEDDSFSDEVGPFSNLDTLCRHVEENKLFQPWGSPGD